jgi:hypothetical protein
MSYPLISGFVAKDAHQQEIMLPIPRDECHCKTILEQKEIGSSPARGQEISPQRRSVDLSNLSVMRRSVDRHTWRERPVMQEHDSH